MTVYKTRQGIVLSEICGEYVLVAAKSLQDTCPYVSQINESSAFLWKKLEEGAGIDQLVNAIKEEYDSEDDAEIRESVSAFIQQMVDMNYLICLETGEEENEKE